MHDNVARVHFGGGAHHQDVIPGDVDVVIRIQPIADQEVVVKGGYLVPELRRIATGDRGPVGTHDLGREDVRVVGVHLEPGTQKSFVRKRRLFKTKTIFPNHQHFHQKTENSSDSWMWRSLIAPL